MSRDLSIALAGASVPILGFIVARWEATREAIGHSAWNVARLAVVIVCLIVSIVGGALVTAEDDDPSELFLLVQFIGVGGGAVNAAFPLIVDLGADLEKRMPPKAYRLLQRALAGLLVAGFLVLVAVSMPWWHALLLMGALLATPGWPGRGEELVGPPTEQQRLAAQRLVERELLAVLAAIGLPEPAADPQALGTGRVLDHSVERDVLAYHDLPHCGSPFVGSLRGSPKWRNTGVSPKKVIAAIASPSSVNTIRP
jgi:MFS family permease